RALEYARRRYAHGVVIEAGRRLLKHARASAEARSETARAVGFAHMNQGEMQPAIASFQQAAAHARDAIEKGRALSAEADVNRNLAQLADSERLFREALACLPDEHPDHAVAWRQLATLYLMRGDVEQGEVLLRQALQASLAAGEQSS